MVPNHTPPARGTLASARSLVGTAAGLWVLGSSLSPSTGAPTNDPTRPPANFVQPQGATDGNGPQKAGPARAPAAPPLQAEPLPLLLLQGLQVSGNGAATALIDGRLVRPGDTVGGRKVISIDAGGVALQGSGGTERLTLLAGNHKQPVGSAGPSRTTAFQAAPLRVANGVDTPGMQGQGDTAMVAVTPTPAATTAQTAKPTATPGAAVTTEAVVEQAQVTSTRLPGAPR